MRAHLLDTAGRLLAEEGPAALTMRRVAAEVGCSTTVLYTLFGGKDGLAAGLYREGFARLRRRLDALPPGPDPVGRLLVLGAAYRASALADPHYYRVMFLGAIPGFVPDEDARAGCDAAFAPLVEAAHAGIEAGLLPASDERFTAAARAAVSWFVSPGGAAGPLDHDLSGPP